MAPVELRSSALIIAALLATVSTSSPAPEAAPVYAAPPPEDSSAPPQYAYAYDVQDPFYGVYTSKSETRDGDVVRGSYSVDDPDGFRRTVVYTSDPVRGFNAEVRRQGGLVVPQVAVQAIPTIPVPLPLSVPVVQSYVASPPPAPTPVQQFVYASPYALPLAAAQTSVWRTFAPGLEPARFRTSLTSPTYSYAY